MNVHQFIESRKHRWSRLQEFLQRAGRMTLVRVPLDEFRDGSLAYRETVADLAFARMRYPEHQVVRDLERAVAQAHSVVYQARRVKRKDWREFWLHTWPSLVIECRRPIFIACLIFWIATVVGFFLAARFPRLESFFISPKMREAISSGHLWTESMTSVAPQASSGIATNNISVSLAAWALGITFGAGTVWLLVTNGLMLGVISVGCLRAGVFSRLAEFVVAHGALELPAIWIAAGAGLVLGRALVFPGRYSRGHEVRVAGRRSMQLLVGVVPMLLIAGFVEGFISPSVLPASLKVALATVLAIAYAAYIIAGSRTARPDKA